MHFREDEVNFIQQEPGLYGVYKIMERAARICYKTENLINDNSAKKIIDSVIIPSGHTSVLEFGTVYLKFSIFKVNKYLKYIKDRYSRVVFYGMNVYVTTTYRTIMQGYYKNPVYSIKNNFDKNWKSDLSYICDEPTNHHHKRYCYHFVMDRIGSQSVMRHRGVYGISYAQESTRFCNYNKDKFDRSISISIPSIFYVLLDKFNNEKTIEENIKDYSSLNVFEWSLEEQINFLRTVSYEWNDYEKLLEQSEKTYLKLIEYGWKPEDARGVLPFDLKTEFLMCAYKEDWDMWLFRRLDKHAHPHIRRIAQIFYKKCFYK